MMELKTIEFIKNNDNWKEILTSKPYHISVNEDENYYILKYNQIYSDFSLDIVKECRGLIIDKKTLSAKALSFIKFFNYGEPNAHRIDWNSARVQEKVDGSKILVWFDNGEWHISTSGTIDAYRASVSGKDYTYGEIFYNAVLNANLDFNKELGIYDKASEKSLLEKSKCYTFELVSPDTRVVVPYKKTEIYFTSVRTLDTFDEINPEGELIYGYLKHPKSFVLNSLKACLEATKKMGFDEEGFVVVDKSWNRIKIKSPAYVNAHYVRFSVGSSNGAMLELIESNEKDEFLTYFPEWREQIENTENIIKEYKLNLRKAIEDIDKLDFETQKEYAMYILKNYKNISGFLFNFLKVDLIDVFIKSEWDKLSTDKKLELLGIKTKEDKIISNDEE